MEPVKVVCRVIESEIQTDCLRVNKVGDVGSHAPTLRSANPVVGCAGNFDTKQKRDHGRCRCKNPAPGIERLDACRAGPQQGNDRINDIFAQPYDGSGKQTLNH